jgi:hypothetical protein
MFAKQLCLYESLAISSFHLYHHKKAYVPKIQHTLLKLRGFIPYSFSSIKSKAKCVNGGVKY